MWIEISKDIFEQSDFKGLNYLYQLLSWFPKSDSNDSIPRYNIFIRQDQVSHTDNYKRLTQIEDKFDELIDAAFNEFVNTSSSGKKADFFITSKRIERGFNIEEAIRFFNQPVSVILENNKNDARFIRTVIYAFGRKGIIKKHLENGWIQFENAGGCSNVKNFIEGELKKYEDLAGRNEREAFEYYRALVILDSDKSYSTEPPKPEYLKLTIELNEVKVGFHILTKRAIENYLPDKAFENLKGKLSGINKNKDLIAWINTYLNLEPQQKDFLNINRGEITKDNKGNSKTLPVEIQKLYQNVSPHNLGVLDAGFRLSNFKDTYTELFENNPSAVNSSTLLNRAASTNSAEFEEILNKIYKMI
ncbi:MAG: hypothetical protein IPN76_11995 [Saprospiraceae bacterium]|nr:hypothetical protein [Saprospiraceae bacterium]